MPWYQDVKYSQSTCFVIDLEVKDRKTSTLEDIGQPCWPSAMDGGRIERPMSRIMVPTSGKRTDAQRCFRAKRTKGGK